jgi:hypothetical protein
MARDKYSAGYQWAKFLELWPFLIVALIAILTDKVLTFFFNLKGTTWICFFIASFTLMILGAGLIGYAKLPIYRSGRFLTFGINSIPEYLKRYYRWGWRLFLFGVILSLCLFLSKS